MLLITGAAGNSGRLILKALSQQAQRLGVLVRRAETLELFSGMQGVEVQVADLARPETLEPALDGVDTALHLREAPSIARASVLELPAAEIELSPVDLADIASIAAAVLADDQVDGQRLAITGPQALTMHEVARAIEEAIGRSVVPAHHARRA